MSRGSPPTVCPACEQTPQQTLTLANGAPLLQCPRCRLAWWNWPDFDPESFYDREYFQSAANPKGYDDYRSLEPGVRKTARARLGRIEALQRRHRSKLLDPTPGEKPRLLEIGCGTGCFLDEAAKRGWDADGVEVSEYAAAEARSRGCNVTVGPIEEIEIARAEYDAVALWDVIEHMRDPLAAIQLAAQSLRTGGVLALSTGDVTSLCARLSGKRWHLFNLPEHLYFFSPDSLRRMLLAQRCRVVAQAYEVNWVPAAYLAERVLKSFGLSGSAALSLRKLPGLIPATLRDVLGIYAIRA